MEVKLNAGPKQIDLGGVRVDTWAYDGLLPGKEIRAKRGDLLRVELRNALPQPTTIHWHGLALRNDMDGVPDLTQAAVTPAASFRYEFVVPDPGTYWFHPHVGVQLDRGLYAPLIIEDPAEPGNYDREVVVVVDDWLDGIDRDPDMVFEDLRQNGMGGGMDHGAMPGMAGMPKSELLGGDVGDVTYPHFLANGKLPAQPQVIDAAAGQRVRLRLINAAADTAFRVGVPGQPLTITHTDGFPVVARQAETVLLGMGERIDAIVQLPDTTVPVLAIAEGRDGHAQVVFRIGNSATPAAQPLVRDMLARPVLTSVDVVAERSVLIPQRQPDVVHEMILEGPTGTYTWTINGRAYDPNEGFAIKQGQLARIKFTNKSMMFHPMHVHGHTFQVRRSGGTGPRKDTLTVLPHQSIDADIVADNPGQWLTHCHNVYHGEAGMMAVLSYVE